jgi:transcriptional regulator with XRE-family HTH domain
MVIKSDFIASMEAEHELRIQKAFGNRVRELRKLRQLSQETLALACDLDRTYIGGVERGERNISLINIHKIADALGVDTRDMFDA